MKNAFLVIAAVMMIIMTTGAAPSAPVSNEAGETSMELQPAYTRNLLNVGEMAYITLDENQTTGYIWHHEIMGAGVVEIVSDKYILDPRYADSDGAGGTRHIELKAVNPGRAILNLVCRRDKDIYKTTAYHISVIPAYPVLDSERENELAVGGYAMLILDENRSVGDAYYYTISGEAVKATLDRRITNPSEEGWTGVGHVRVIVFEGLEVGEAEINLVYKYRGKFEWEKKFHIKTGVNG